MRFSQLKMLIEQKLTRQHVFYMCRIPSLSLCIHMYRPSCKATRGYISDINERINCRNTACKTVLFVGGAPNSGFSSPKIVTSPRKWRPRRNLNRHTAESKPARFGHLRQLLIAQLQDIPWQRIELAPWGIFKSHGHAPNIALLPPWTWFPWGELGKTEPLRRIWLGIIPKIWKKKIFQASNELIFFLVAFCLITYDLWLLCPLAWDLVSSCKYVILEALLVSDMQHPVPCGNCSMWKLESAMCVSCFSWNFHFICCNHAHAASRKFKPIIMAASSGWNVPCGWYSTRNIWEIYARRLFRNFDIG